MKKIFIVLTMVVFTGLSAPCQGITVPEAVKNAFATKFPSATNVKWEKENTKEYEASFKVSGTDISANFTIDGNWVETESEISISELPGTVSSAIMAKYPGAVIKGADKIEKPGGKTFYEADIKLNGKNKELLLNTDGSFIK
jgi:Putative beta-lactamase-inhibitor-like, PepSY-like